MWVWNFVAHIEGGNRIRVSEIRAYKIEVRGYGKKPHNNELRYLLSSPYTYVIGVTKYKRMTGVRH